MGGDSRKNEARFETPWVSSGWLRRRQLDSRDLLAVEKLDKLVGADKTCPPAAKGDRRFVNEDGMPVREGHDKRQKWLAPQVLAVLKGWGWSDDDSRNEILNVNGSGISLGHPIGATGGRILANLTRELVRRDGRYGLETMCIGGGQGIAAIFERAA